MSMATLRPTGTSVDRSVVVTLSSNAGIKVREDHIDDFAIVLEALDQSIQDILEEEDYVPTPDLNKYPRTNIHRPEYIDSDKGGWATKCDAYCISPTSSILEGLKVALKDNIALAGVKCTNGTEALDWTPTIDATIATRIVRMPVTSNPIPI